MNKNKWVYRIGAGGMAHHKKVRVKFEFDEQEDKKWRAVYAPVSAELGYAAVAWNRMHDNLGLLFTQVLGLKRDMPKVMAALAVWHASDNDRIMREGLLEAAEVRFKKRKAILDDIRWLLSAAKELSADRNTAVHALLKVDQQQDGTFRIVSDDMTGHKKAKKLKKSADLVAEFSSYATCATLLSHFANMLANHLWSPKDNLLQERPTLPQRWQRTTQAEQRQKKAAKQTQRRMNAKRTKSRLRSAGR